MKIWGRGLGVKVVVVVMGVTVLSVAFFLVISPSLPYTRSWVTAVDTPVQSSSGGSRTGRAPCRRSLAFSSQTLPVTALASVQGSGNTWVRHLLQQLTGIYTGSVYGRRGDPELWIRGYHGEGISDGRVIAIKTHGLPFHPMPKARYARAIIIRNPFDAMFADFNRRASWSHTGTAPSAAYFEYWNDFSKEYATRWSRFHFNWLHFKGPLLFLNFQDLQHSLSSVVKKLAEFLDQPSLVMDIRCAIADSEGVAKRGGVSFEKRDVFSQNLTRHINARIRDVEQMLADRFPQLSKAVSSWTRNSTEHKLKWRPLPQSIS